MDGRSFSSPTGPGERRLRRSVHAAGSLLLMSAMVRMPAAIARSAQRRAAE
jgi:hypothetical protein